MSRPLRVLLVEDSADDAELVVAALRRAGYQPSWRRVYRAEDMTRALAEETFDIVLSDYRMPQFTGVDALRLLRERGLDLPFILVSGSVGEEVAVDAMRAGAHDYFRKDNLTRLPAAIDRELREAAGRKGRRATERALAEIQRTHRLTLDSIRDYAIFNMGLDGTILTWNPGVERIKGYREEEFVGRPFAILFPPEARERGLPEQEMRIAREQGRYEGEGVRMRKDGSLFWAEVSLTPLHGAEGNHVGYTKVTRDVSERKRLIDDLRVAIEARDEFLSIASHELRTPVTSLRLQLESALPLARSATAGAKLAHKLDAALRHTDRLASLIDSLLDVSRIRAGQLELRQGRVDLVELAQETIAGLEGVRQASGSEIRVVSEGPVHGQFDPERLHMVLTSLLTNALKFGLGRPVEVSVLRRDDRALLLVRDHGTGIDPAEHERIFERYGRAVPETHYGGFGVGLWVAREVARAHGGDVTVDSAPDRGSTFTVNLPIGPTA